MKKILLMILLICTIQLSSASISYHYDTNGTGTFSLVKEKIYYYPDGHNVYMYWTFYISEQCGGYGSHCVYPRFKYLSGTTWYWWYDGLNDGGCGLKHIEKSRHGTEPQSGEGLYYHCDNYPDYYLILVVSDTPLSEYTLSGDMVCVDSVQLYQKNNDGEYQLIDHSTSEHYSFNIRDQQEYKLVFDDGHEYEFTCNNSDVEYNYDACNYGIINLYDNCANLLINPFIVVYILMII